MNTNNESKLNQLIQKLLPGTVVTAMWLKEQGYPHDLQHSYLRGGWLESIGSGAFKRKNDKIDIYGAVYALQTQMNKPVHIGGRSALSLQGYGHYIEMQPATVQLFTTGQSKLPAWFLNYAWQPIPDIYSTNFISYGYGLVDYDYKSFTLSISDPALAIMEQLMLAPGKADLEEAYSLMEGLNTLHPVHVQDLLEACTSIKVKRLFLHLAEKAGHQWVKAIKINRINLGSGKRHLVPDGILAKKYQLILPASLV